MLARMKPRLLVLGGLVVIAIVIAIFAPLILELNQINTIRGHYRLEKAVYEELINDPVRNPTVDQLVNPEFLKKYGLSRDQYLDSGGYFLPNGEHWMKWKSKTKTAAILLFAGKSDPSTWTIYRMIQMTDDYYAHNDKNTPVVKVVAAIMKLK